MPLLPFDTCRRRIERAKAHSETFAKLWRELLEEDPYTSILHVEDNGAGASGSSHGTRGAYRTYSASS